MYEGKSKRKLGKRHYYVDFERARRKDNWLPRKFGGGKGENKRDFPKEVYDDIKRVKKQFPNLIKGNKYEIEKGEINESENSESYYRNSDKYIGNKRERSRSYSSRSRGYKSRSRSYRRRSDSRYYKGSDSEGSFGRGKKKI